LGCLWRAKCGRVPRTQNPGAKLPNSKAEAELPHSKSLVVLQSKPTVNSNRELAVATETLRPSALLAAGK